jgi:hypothetical protein
MPQINFYKRDQLVKSINVDDEDQPLSVMELASRLKNSPGSDVAGLREDNRVETANLTDRHEPVKVESNKLRQESPRYFAAKPSVIEVTFLLPFAGNIRAYYHDVVEKDGIIVLVFDTRDTLHAYYEPPCLVNEDGTPKAIVIKWKDRQRVCIPSGVDFAYGDFNFFIFLESQNLEEDHKHGHGETRGHQSEDANGRASADSLSDRSYYQQDARSEQEEVEKTHQD